MDFWKALLTSKNPFLEASLLLRKCISRVLYWPQNIMCKPFPPPSSQALRLVLNAVYDIVRNLIRLPVSSLLDPKLVLSGNFAPVDKLPPTDCEIIKETLPPCLDGVYIRNGPNPQYLPRGPYYLFDGDGMVHCVRISKGRAILCSHYVKTYKQNTEREAGFPTVPG
ncbi:hypothetical protein DITRI_Ditri03aG0047000 [Diplodiscus trichospermus]